MSERRSLGRLAREPLYNTAAVVRATGIPAETIRAWERRYGLPRPFRTPTRQRLYSEQDIGVISWLRERTDEGMTISQAIQRLQLEFPDVAGRPAAVQHPAPASVGDEIADLRRRLIEASAAFDSVAERIIDEALARLSIVTFCTSFVEPLLGELAERRNRNDLNVAAGHVALRTLGRRLSALLPLVTPVRGRGNALVAAPSGVEQDAGSLMLALVLGQRGWRVVELGANVPADVLLAAADATRPDLICLRATTENAASQALSLAHLLMLQTDDPP
ncbi:MAG TPA: MerR family transcriptional regulator, partial [Thermomicrobiales bacterium]|nr:MerR family transcriptional regulator [Thermomicrobiales bacterium]